MNGKYLNFAVGLARQAGKTFKKNFGKPLEILKKGGNPRDLVTEVDTKIEQFLKNKIHRHFPDHDILGEELGSATFNRDKGLKWFIDPIDGTANYIQGLPLACISLALWDQTGPLTGVVYNPVNHNLYSAQKGRGAFLNNKRIYVSNVSETASAFGGVGWGRDITKGSKTFPHFLKLTKKVRTLGSAAYETCLVAEGKYDYLIHASLNIWDIAAAILIATEAGGKVTDWNGRPVTPQSENLLVSNAKLYQKLLKEVKKL